MIKRAGYSVLVSKIQIYMWKNHFVTLTRYYISAYIISSQKRMAEAKTDIQENHQSKLSSQVTLKIFIDNDRLLTYGTVLNIRQINEKLIEYVYYKYSSLLQHYQHSSILFQFKSKANRKQQIFTDKMIFKLIEQEVFR